MAILFRTCIGTITVQPSLGLPLFRQLSTVNEVAGQTACVDAHTPNESGMYGAVSTRIITGIGML